MTLVHALSWRYLIRSTRAGVPRRRGSCSARSVGLVVLGAESEFWGSRRSCRSCGSCGHRRVGAGRRGDPGCGRPVDDAGDNPDGVLTVGRRSQALHPGVPIRPPRHAARPQLSTGGVDNFEVARVTRGWEPGLSTGLRTGVDAPLHVRNIADAGWRHAVPGAKLRPGVDSICTQGCGQPVDNSMGRERTCRWAAAGAGRHPARDQCDCCLIRLVSSVTWL